MTMQQLQIIDDMLGEKESTAPSFLFLNWCQKFCNNARVVDGGRGRYDSPNSAYASKKHYSNRKIF